MSFISFLLYSLAQVHSSPFLACNKNLPSHSKSLLSIPAVFDNDAASSCPLASFRLIAYRVRKFFPWSRLIVVIPFELATAAQVVATRR